VNQSAAAPAPAQGQDLPEGQYNVHLLNAMIKYGMGHKSSSTGSKKFPQPAGEKRRCMASRFKCEWSSI
jgi:hypothetical protein